MIQLFKKSNDKAGAEVDPKDPTKQKWNADTVFVQVENEMVSLSELAKHAKENEYEKVQSVENELEIDGTLHNVSDLITLYKASKSNEESKDTKKKDPAEKSEEERKKDEEGKDNKKNEEEKEKEEKDKENKKNEEEKEKDKEKENEESEEDDVEEKIKKNGKENDKEKNKDVRHFLRLNTARENGSATSTLTIDTMHNRIDRGKNRYGSEAK